MIQNLQTFPYSPSTFVKKLREKKILFIASGFSCFFLSFFEKFRLSVRKIKRKHMVKKD